VISHEDSSSIIQRETLHPIPAKQIFFFFSPSLSDVSLPSSPFSISSIIWCMYIHLALRISYLLFANPPLATCPFFFFFFFFFVSVCMSLLDGAGAEVF
jgi:hypothetical protein